MRCTHTAKCFGTGDAGMPHMCAAHMHARAHARTQRSCRLYRFETPLDKFMIGIEAILGLLLLKCAKGIEIKVR